MFSGIKFKFERCRSESAMCNITGFVGTFSSTLLPLKDFICVVLQYYISFHKNFNTLLLQPAS